MIGDPVPVERLNRPRTHLLKRTVAAAAAVVELALVVTRLVHQERERIAQAAGVAARALVVSVPAVGEREVTVAAHYDVDDVGRTAAGRVAAGARIAEMDTADAGLAGEPVPQRSGRRRCPRQGRVEA